jgi:hypothetical protein
MGLLRRPTPGGIVEDGRLGRPCGPGALRAQLEKNQFAATLPFPYFGHQSCCHIPRPNERGANLGMIRGGSAFLDDVCIRPAVLGEEDSMGSDHHFTSMDGQVPLAVAGRRSGWFRSWRLARSAAWGWTTISGAGRCAGRLGGSGCDG